MGNASVAADSIEYFEEGSWSGVAGSWEKAAGGGLVATTPGAAYFSGTKALVPAGRVRESGSAASSEAVGDSLPELWSRFAGTGSVGPAAAAAAAALAESGSYGAVTVAHTVPPGETVFLRIVLSWHHPNRFHFGSRLGNRYAVKYSDAEAVAAVNSM